MNNKKVKYLIHFAVIAFVLLVFLSGFTIQRNIKVGNALTVAYPIDGGTGTSSVNATDVGKYLKVTDDSPFTYGFDSPSAGAQTPITQDVDMGGFNFTNGGTITARNFIATSTTATSTFKELSFTNATGTNLSVTGSSSFAWMNLGSTTANSLDMPSIASALVLTNGNGHFAGYAGTSCTNQFPRSLSALGAASCASVATTDFASANISQWTNNSGYVTFPWTVNATNNSTSTLLAFTQGFISNASSTSVGGLTMTTATTTNATSTNGFYGNIISGSIGTFTTLTATGTLNIPNGTSPTVSTAGNIAVDTTTGQLLVYGREKQVYVATSTMRFTLASTTLLSGTTTIPMGTFFQNATIKAIGCYASSTGTFNLTMFNGSSASTLIACSSTQLNTFNPSNNTVAANAKWSSMIGGVSATPPDWITISYGYTYDAD